MTAFRISYKINEVIHDNTNIKIIGKYLYSNDIIMTFTSQQFHKSYYLPIKNSYNLPCVFSGGAAFISLCSLNPAAFLNEDSILYDLSK